ncbi:MAG TPA: zf-TFIIB domain-containing protein [Pirellulales bacterium]|nr:zf-TFIIB domain-containing protein [Pirellulales bacterium]
MSDRAQDSEPNPHAPTFIDGDAGRDPSEFFASLASLNAAHDNDSLVPPGQRTCPICRAAMQSRALHSIPVDICPDHGIWLDNGKLESLTENISVSVKLRAADKTRKPERPWAKNRP